MREPGARRERSAAAPKIALWRGGGSPRVFAGIIIITVKSEVIFITIIRKLKN